MSVQIVRSDGLHTRVLAYANKRIVGQLTLNRYSDHMAVSEAWVDPAFRRLRVATRMYEEAAKWACEEFGVGLRSDVSRNVVSEAFWSKQGDKGRATYNDENNQYELGCPAEPLDGCRRRQDPG